MLALFALLAAVYLTVEADEPALKDDFRRRALACTLLLGALAWLAALLSEEGAPRLHEVLLRGGRALVFQGLCALTAAALVAALLGRRYRLARFVAGALTVLVVGGFLNAQRPYVLFPEFPIEQAAAPPQVLRAMLLTLAVGSALLVPALLYLYRIFKHERAEHARSES